MQPRMHTSDPLRKLRPETPRNVQRGISQLHKWYKGKIITPLVSMQVRWLWGDDLQCLFKIQLVQMTNGSAIKVSLIISIMS
jgi:hypothetical protein